MDLFRNLKTFLYNHRKKFLVSGIAISGTVALVSYLRYELQRQEKRRATVCLETIRRQRHFETLEDTCFQTIINLGSRLQKELGDLLNIDHIVSTLRQNPPNSIELWESLKINVFTEMCLMVYAQVLLVFVLKVQFSVIGGYLYKASINGGGSSSTEDKTEQGTVNRATQEQYLSLCVNFVKNGLPELCGNVRAKVSPVLSAIDLKRKLSVQNLQEIFWSIQTSVNNEEFIGKIPKYVQMEGQLDRTTDPVLRQIYEETADILSKRELTSHCVNSLLSCGFMFAIDQLMHVFNANVPSTVMERSSAAPVTAVATSMGSVQSSSLPIAKMLPTIHNTVKLKDISSLLKCLMKSEKLQILAANIYESFC